MLPSGRHFNRQTSESRGAPGTPAPRLMLRMFVPLRASKTRIVLSVKPATTVLRFCQVTLMQRALREADRDKKRWKTRSLSAVESTASDPSPQPTTRFCPLNSPSTSVFSLVGLHRGCAAKHQTSLKLPVDARSTSPVPRFHSVTAAVDPILNRRSCPTIGFPSWSVSSGSWIQQSASTLLSSLAGNTISCTQFPLSAFQISMSPFARPSASFSAGLGSVRYLSLDRDKARVLMGDAGYSTKRERWISMMGNLPIISMSFEDRN